MRTRSGTGKSLFVGGMGMSEMEDKENQSTPLLPTNKLSLFARTAAILLLSGAFVACVHRPDILAALTLVPAWLWFLPALATVICSWRLKDRRFAFGLVVLWAVFGVVSVEETSILARSVIRSVVPREPSTETIRVVTLNCDSISSCIEDLRHVDPDVVLLQESPGTDELHRLTQLLFAGDGHFITAGDTSILARGRIDSIHNQRGKHFLAVVVSLIDKPPIHCVSLRLTPPVARIDFWSAEFWTDHRARRDKHREQLREVMQVLRDTLNTEACVVGGDFNMTPLDRAFSELAPGLVDSFLQSGTGLGGTGTNDWPLFRVDQIWSNERCRSDRTYVRKWTGTDHRLVVCEMRIEN